MAWPWVFPRQIRLGVTKGLGSAKQQLEPGQNIRTIQELLGLKDVGTTMIYTHGLNPGALRVQAQPTFCNRPNSWFSDP